MNLLSWRKYLVKLVFRLDQLLFQPTMASNVILFENLIYYNLKLSEYKFHYLWYILTILFLYDTLYVIYIFNHYKTPHIQTKGLLKRLINKYEYFIRISSITKWIYNTTNIIIFNNILFIDKIWNKHYMLFF